MLAFAATNAFHDAASRLRLIDTPAPTPGSPVASPGTMRFCGVGIGGIVVSCALVERLPPPVLRAVWSES